MENSIATLLNSLELNRNTVKKADKPAETHPSMKELDELKIIKLKK